MLFFMPMMWAAPRADEVIAKKAQVRGGGTAKKEKVSVLLDKISPEFMVTATRSALLAMTTSLTRVSTRVHGACQQLSHALAVDRMMRSMFPWAMPSADPFDFSQMGAWFTGGRTRKHSVAPASFYGAPSLYSAPAVEPAFWWPGLPEAARAKAPASPFFADFWAAPLSRPASAQFAPSIAFPAPIFGLFAAMAPAGVWGGDANPFWTAFFR
jgi:hypothetical protein